MITFALIESAGEPPRCTRCREPIEGPWLLTCQWNNASRYHFDCAVDINAASARDVLSSNSVEIADRGRLLALATARADAELDANRLTKKKRATRIEPESARSDERGSLCSCERS